MKYKLSKYSLIIMFFYFIFFSLYPNSICIFQLEFYKKNNTNYTFENDIMQINYFSKLSVGTPLLEIESLITLESNSLYITEGLVYNSNLSSSYLGLKPEESRFNNEKFERAIFSSESFSLYNINKNKIKIKNIQFMLVTKTPVYNIKFPMSIGLKTKDNQIKDYNLIYQLKKNNYIDSYSFTIKFENENKGKIIIGNLPHEYEGDKYYSGAFRYTNLVVDSKVHYWKFNVENAYCGFDIFEKNRDIELSMNYGVFVGTLTYRDIILKKFFDERIKNKICEKKMVNGTNYNYFSCNNNLDIIKFPILKFHSKVLNYTFEFDYNDLFKKINDGNYVFLIVFNIYFNSNWILGVPFLKKYQMIFDQDRAIIGFYIYSKENKNNLNIPRIISLILLFIIIILIVLFLKSLSQKRRKVRANEIDEFYDYVPYKNMSINDN